jgi:nucleoside diphosphate kinase
MLSLTDLEFIGARMYAPSDAMIDAYKVTVEQSSMRDSAKRLFAQYLDEACRPKNRLGVPNRMMMLLFRGEQAAEKLADVIGPVSIESRGDTVRGSFGDLVSPRADKASDSVTMVVDRSSTAVYFEPAVLNAPDAETAATQLAILAQYAESDGGVLENVIQYKEGITPETTLVMLKPESFEARSARAGNMIDMFSRTGLYLVGARLLRMSYNQAEEFYGFLRGVFVKKLKGLVAARLKAAIGDAKVLGFSVTESQVDAMSDVLKSANAEHEFGRIVEYMTGLDVRGEMSPEEKSRPGKAKALALLYQGRNAVEKIRAKLGPTNPDAAEGGTIRADYGTDILHNGAHASDSVESYVRERTIVGLSGGEPSEEKALILKGLGR